MDTQGKPTGVSHKGTKNTTDPSAAHPSLESAGPIASDSLAAESVHAGGKFAENRNATPLSVKGANSTLATTDTSAATTLPPAPDAESRDEETERRQIPASEKGPGGQKYAEAMHGQAKFSGVQTAEGYVGGSEDAKRAMESPGLVETAPSYVQNVIAQTGKPKGRHLTEGGFVGESANTHGFGKIGSKDDPGREGEKHYYAGHAGGGPRQDTITGDGQYDALKDESA